MLPLVVSDSSRGVGRGYMGLLCQFSSVQFSCSVVSDFLWPHGPQHARPPCPSPTPRVYSNSYPLDAMMFRWCHPAISSSVIPFSCPQIPPSIRVFSNESTLHTRWPKYWSFSFNISLSIEHPGLISFRMDWLDLLAVQGILKSLLQHHSSKASILQLSAFFLVQLLQPYMTTGKTTALTRQTFVGKVISLLFNMLSRVGHNFPSKEQTSFNSMAAVTICSDSGAQENNICHCFLVYLPWSDGTRCHNLSFLNVEF